MHSINSQAAMSQQAFSAIAQAKAKAQRSDEQDKGPKRLPASSREPLGSHVDAKIDAYFKRALEREAPFLFFPQKKPLAAAHQEFIAKIKTMPTRELAVLRQRMEAKLSSLSGVMESLLRKRENSEKGFGAGVFGLLLGGAPEPGGLLVLGGVPMKVAAGISMVCGGIAAISAALLMKVDEHIENLLTFQVRADLIDIVKSDGQQRP